MMSFLAQAKGDGSTRAVANIFKRVDALAHPDELVQHLQEVPIVLAGVFIAAGLVCMLQGFRLYKLVVVLIALVTGVAVGHHLGKAVEAEVIVAVCLGILLAVVAWPLMKYAVAVAGGLAGAFVGANAWSVTAAELSSRGVQVSADMPWIGALVGLLLLGLLSFILFELSVVLFTSFSGSIMVLLGIVAMLLQIEPWREGIANALAQKPIVLPMLMFVPAVIGLVLQYQWGGFSKISKPQAGGAQAEAKA